MAFNYDLTIEQGAVFHLPFTWNENGSAKNLAGWEAQSEIRKKAGGVVILDLTPHITVEPGGTTGRVEITVSAHITDTLPPGTWAYDLFMWPTADEPSRVRLLQGKATIVKQVTDVDPVIP